MAKIYASGNYVIVEDGDNLYEYAKGHTLYLLVDDIFYIKEITQGQYKVSVADLEAGNITSEDSGDVYNVNRFTTFLRENTGFKTAPGGSGAEWGSITGTLSTQSDLQSALNAKQNSLTLTTTGTSGASTLVGSTLNIPQYSGGGGSGIHAQKIIVSQQWTNTYLGYASGPTTSAASANRIYCVPFFPNQTFTCDALAINVSTLSIGGLAKILIYSDVNGVPTTKLYESADLDCSTIGQKTASTSFTFNSGTTYWLSFIVNNSTNLFTYLPQSTVFAFSTSSAFGAATHGYLPSVTFNATPTTLTALIYATGNVPMISIKKA
jgi:hypothetical protein